MQENKRAGVVALVAPTDLRPADVVEPLEWRVWSEYAASRLTHAGDDLLRAITVMQEVIDMPGRNTRLTKAPLKSAMRAAREALYLLQEASEDLPMEWDAPAVSR